MKARQKTSHGNLGEGEDYPHRGQKISNDTHRSKTDLDARLGRKSFRATTELCNAATYVMDNKSRIIVGADVGRPDKRTDCEKALQQVQRMKWTYKIKPESLGEDKGYAAGEFLHNLETEKIQPHIPIVDYRRHNGIGIYTIKDFHHDKQKDVFICPEGKELKYWGIHKHSRQHVYRARKKACSICLKKAECTKDTARSVSYHIYEDSIEKTRQLNKTTEYRISQRMRKKIEELFGEAKEFMGLRQAKFRRTKFVREQVLMTATAQNIKRMIKMPFRRGPAEGAVSITVRLSHFLSEKLVAIFSNFYRDARKTQFYNRESLVGD